MKKTRKVIGGFVRSDMGYKKNPNQLRCAHAGLDIGYNKKNIDVEPGRSWPTKNAANNLVPRPKLLLLEPLQGTTKLISVTFSLSCMLFFGIFEL